MQHDFRTPADWQLSPASIERIEALEVSLTALERDDIPDDLKGQLIKAVVQQIVNSEMLRILSPSRIDLVIEAKDVYEKLIEIEGAVEKGIENLEKLVLKDEYQYSFCEQCRQCALEIAGLDRPKRYRCSKCGTMYSLRFVEE